MRKLKRFWRLYRELRSLRVKCEILTTRCERLEGQRDAALRACRATEADKQVLIEKLNDRGHRVLLSVPTAWGIASPYATVDAQAERCRALDVERKLTDSMKIKLVDDLIAAGWIKKQEETEYCTVYSLRLAKELNDD